MEATDFIIALYVITAVQAPFPDVTTAVQAPFPDVTTVVQAPLPDVTTAVQAPFPDVTTAVQAPFPDVTTAVQAPFPDVTTNVQAPFPDVTTAVQAPLPDVTTAVQAPFPDVTTAVQAPFPDVTTAVQAPFPDVTTAVQAPFPDVRPEQREVDCSPCKCNMQTRTANCIHLDLHYIPALPAGIEFLYFEYNSLARVTRTTFENISHLALREFCLAYNGIREISRDAFQALDTSRLRYLSLRNNGIDAQNLAQILNVIGRFPELKELNLEHLNLTIIPDNFLEALSNSSVTRLLLSENHLNDLHVTYISSMHRLQGLFLRGNLFLDFDTNLPSPTDVKSLDLGYNVLQAIPNFCTGTNNFPELRNLSLDYNRIFLSPGHCLSCLKNLETVNLSGNMLLYLFPNFVLGLKSLTSIRMTYMRLLGDLPRQWAASAFNNSWVKEVSMINSGIRIGHDNFSVDIFLGCSGLTRLYLGENFFTDASEDFFERLFQPIQALTFLDLSSTGLTTVPVAISRLVHLKEIWLFNNYIVRWESDLFQPLTSLANISMDHNQITMIDMDSFPSALVQNLRALNLSENPFSCTCELLWFVQWMKNDTRVFTGRIDNYRCASPQRRTGQPLVTLSFTETTCLLGEEDLDMIIVILSIVILLAVIAPLVFRYRWHLQSAVFLIRYRAMREETRRVHRQYQFDAFLIYSETDSRRVRQEFLPRLELDRHLHLCVHERDFLPGKTIVDNIVDCMLASRCVVVLLSNALATSEWCQFEMSLAHAEVMEGGASPLVLLLLEDITPHNMTPTLYGVLKTTTYLRYPTLAQDTDVFWEHVHHALVDEQ